MKIYELTMSVRDIVQQQYQRLVDSAASRPSLQTPPEGWLRTVRKALGMSGPQLAKRMGVTRARVAQAEHAELSGGATLKSMQPQPRRWAAGSSTLSFLTTASRM